MFLIDEVLDEKAPTEALKEHFKKDLIMCGLAVTDLIVKHQWFDYETLPPRAIDECTVEIFCIQDSFRNERTADMNIRVAQSIVMQQFSTMTSWRLRQVGMFKSSDPERVIIQVKTERIFK